MEDIKEKTADEIEDIINDLNSIAYTRPYFSTIIAKTTKYIMELEEENKQLKAFVSQVFNSEGDE